ncbi:hypothetical protein F441_16457 [Phytophthora nicotianae CJ01A1]|uniref:Uncharacterized protein n=2 Tax=Phytophthora nicotianae TaxID=4792 RepID=W2PPH7_PHYN3|nr:hypothetical protein PPTG_23855 [Phytophthora nicotianae INRA-310]ETN02888.1 hypothetical protein PPTG_23855 [Phytophthora nicotianae INRA-310]ETP07227.1 hypothetical protein F441_16457 [Phytophthora nicotianae CJ01A1]
MKGCLEYYCTTRLIYHPVAKVFVLKTRKITESLLPGQTKDLRTFCFNNSRSMVHIKNLARSPVMACRIESDLCVDGLGMKIL